MESVEVPSVLYKVMSIDAWKISQEKGALHLSTMDADFVHLSKEDQVAHVVSKFWKGEDYVLLRLDPKRFIGRLVYESNRSGSSKYFHLYEGTIPTEAVLEASVVQQT